MRSLRTCCSALACLAALTTSAGALEEASFGASTASSFTVTRRGSGRPMILIPGLASSGAVWDGVVDRFSSRFECHVLTLAGFASPPSSQVLSLPRVRDELIAYVREQKLDRPVLMGHSLGGFLALWVAASAPDLIGPVVSVDGVPFLPALMDPSATPYSVRARADQMRALYASLSPTQLGGQSRLALGAMIKDAANVERAVSWSAASDPASVGAAMFELMTTDLRATVPSIRTPVLLLAAAEFAKDAAQRQTLLAAYEAQVARIQNHEVRLAERARHFIMLDDPEFLFGALQRFLHESVTQ